MKKCCFCTQNSQNWLIFDLKSTELSHNIYFIYIERSARTDSLDIDGTLKFVKYKIGGLKFPIALLKPNVFLIFFVKILSYAHKT